MAIHIQFPEGLSPQSTQILLFCEYPLLRALKNFSSELSEIPMK